MGLLNFHAMMKLAREELVCGLPKVQLIEQPCGGGLAGK
jgi:hypothetical protein